MITIDQLAANVEDDELRLVYADAAMAAGHPRGELVIVQHQLERSPKDIIVAVREHELFEQHPEILLGDIAGRWQTLDEQVHQRPGEMKDLQLVWHLGFIKHARYRPADDDSLIPRLLESLLAHPSGALIERLDLGVFTWGRAVLLHELTKILFASGPRPALRVLELGRLVEDGSAWGGPGHIYIDRDISAVELGPLGALWRTAPRLRELRLHGNHASFERPPEAAELRVFELCTSSLDAEDLALLARATWPRLERCVLWFGDGEYGGGNCDAERVAAFLHSLAGCPQLGHLALANHADTDAIVDVLLDAPPPLLANLRGLDLSLGTLGPAGAGQLASERDRLPQLVELNVADSYLDDATVTALESAFPGCVVLAGSQRETSGTMRYVSVSA